MARTVETASRRRSAEPRLLVGLVLVAASVAGVVGLVSAIDSRTTLYAAAGALAPGERIHRSDLVERAVALDDAPALYLTVGDIPDDGLVVMRPVRAGELLPRSAVADSAGAESTAVVLELAAPVSSSVLPGSEVDVWSSATEPGTRDLAAPAVLVNGAVVVRLVHNDGLVARSDGTALEVLVPRDAVARVLHAQAAGDVLAVVPAGLPAAG